MTTKEKAIDLVGRYYDYVNVFDDEGNANYQQAENNAKQCALIAVDFAKDSKYSFMPMYGGWVSGQQYYEEVKQEINKL